VVTRAQRSARALGILTSFVLFMLALFLAAPVRGVLLRHYSHMIGPSSVVPWPTHALVLPLLGLNSSRSDPLVAGPVWAGVLTGPLLLLLLAVRSSHHTFVRVWPPALGLYLALLLLVVTVLGFFMWLPFARLGCGLAGSAPPACQSSPLAA
jgi:hypothetical protein